MLSIIVVLLLSVSTCLSAPAITTWQVACNGIAQHIPVNLNDSFIYPGANAVVPDPLQNDCTLLFNPMPGVAMHIVITGAYSNNSITVTTLDPGKTTPVQTLQSYEIIPSGVLVTVKINHTLAAPGPLTIQVTGNQVGLNTKPIAVASKSYQAIYSTDYSSQTSNPTFAMTSPTGNKLTFFFCLHPSHTLASQGRFIFYTSANAYLTNGAQFASNSRAYSSAQQSVNVFYDIDPTFIGQVIAYATDNDNVDFKPYSSAFWEGQATIAVGTALVIGRQSGTDTTKPGFISFALSNAATKIVIYSGIVELQNLPTTGIIASITSTSPTTPLVITQPVVTVVATGGNATLMLSTQLPPTTIITTTAPPATTPTFTIIPVTTSMASSTSFYVISLVVAMASVLSK